MRVSRRRFLAWIATLPAAVACNRLLSGCARPSAQRTEFDYLKLEPSALQQFEDDHRRFAGPIAERGAWSEQTRLRFLLSTDFFVHDADSDRTVSYVGYYDPEVTPCNNPLARFE